MHYVVVPSPIPYDLTCCQQLRRRQQLRLLEPLAARRHPTDENDELAPPHVNHRPTCGSPHIVPMLTDEQKKKADQLLGNSAFAPEPTSRLLANSLRRVRKSGLVLNRSMTMRRCLSCPSGDQNTKTLSASAVAFASSSIVLRRAPSMSSLSLTPRASMQVPHKRICPFSLSTRLSIRSTL